MDRLRILQVNVVADRGSTGNICRCIDEALTRQGHRSIVCYGRKDTTLTDRRYKFGNECEAAVSKIVNYFGGLMYASSPIATTSLIRQIRKFAPHVVHLHCINGYCVNIYHLLRFLAYTDIPTVVTHHAEFFYTGNCGHALDCKKFAYDDGCRECPALLSSTGSAWLDRSHTAWCAMRDAFRQFAPGKLIFTAVSPWVRARAEMSRIVDGFKCVVVENGLDTSVFNVTDNRREARGLIPGCADKMVLHVTASFCDSQSAFKGGNYIVELARMMPDVTFVVVATFSTVTGSLPPNLYLFGRADDRHQLAALYNAADLTVIVSRRETFSMVVAESLSCGTPVVGFKAGGPESIALTDYSTFVEYGDIKALCVAADVMLGHGYDAADISSAAVRRYDAGRMADEYIKVYKSHIKSEIS